MVSFSLFGFEMSNNSTMYAYVVLENKSMLVFISVNHVSDYYHTNSTTQLLSYLCMHVSNAKTNKKYVFGFQKLFNIHIYPSLTHAHNSKAK